MAKNIEKLVISRANRRKYFPASIFRFLKKLTVAIRIRDAAKIVTGKPIEMAGAREVIVGDAWGFL